VKRERERERASQATMASGGVVKKEIGGNHDVVRFGVNDSVKGDLAPPHPLQASVHKEAKFWADKKRFGAEAIYGSAFNIRKDLDAQILSKFQRPPGALPSSMLGYEALTGSLDDFGFEDYLNLPQDSESFRAPDMHHGMEVRLGLSKGPVCPSFN
jgi:proteasome maturation protein